MNDSYFALDLFSIFQVANLQALDKVTKKAKSIAIVGGGFLGSELACALGHRGTCIHT